eukprot:g15232.t1
MTCDNDEWFATWFPRTEVVLVLRAKTEGAKPHELRGSRPRVCRAVWVKSCAPGESTSRPHSQPTKLGDILCLSNGLARTTKHQVFSLGHHKTSQDHTPCPDSASEAMTSAEPEAEEVIQADTKVAGDAGAEIATVEAPEVVEEATQGPKAEDLFLLARQGSQQNFEVALKLLEAYPDFWHCQDEDRHTSLVARELSQDFVKAALAQKLPVDSVAKNQQTPLMWAVLRGHVPVARTLLAAKASLAVKDSLGATALMIAVQHKAYPSILLLMHRGSHMQAQMLAEGDKNGCTAVHWAAYKERSGEFCFDRLLHYFKADLQVLDNAKMLPLHRAVCAAQTAVVEFLVEQKSDPQARNHEGKSCLDIAAEKHDVHMQALLKRLVSKVPADPFAGGKVEPEDVEAGKDKAIWRSVV